jgi:hypothetical protein
MNVVREMPKARVHIGKSAWIEERFQLVASPSIMMTLLSGKTEVFKGHGP